MSPVPFSLSACYPVNPIRATAATGTTGRESRQEVLVEHAGPMIISLFGIVLVALLAAVNAAVNALAYHRRIDQEKYLQVRAIVTHNIAPKHSVQSKVL